MRLSDHPHVRGEHLDRSCSVLAVVGSSPRAWGTLRGTRFFGTPPRIIPTCVGNTRHPHKRFRYHPDHPHVRGEHLYVVKRICDWLGSSPRAWGTRNCLAKLSRSGGSSPRAWGTRWRHAYGRAFHRIIPTCVGNTLTSSFSSSSMTDHPHVRGEHTHMLRRRKLAAGSSPRAWGTQATCNPHLQHLRIIPTCVGNTLVVTIKDTKKFCHSKVYRIKPASHATFTSLFAC